MFDFSWSEIAILVVVALIFIGPKDMPVAIRTVSRGIKSLRRMASEFQTHVDEMVREADLGDARDHLRDLKKLDVRGQFMRAIDGDNSIRDSLTPIQSAPRDPAPAPGFVPPETMPVAAPAAPVVEEPPGPSILPPGAVKRVRADRAWRRAPHIVPPPRAVHAGRRVPLETHDV